MITHHFFDARPAGSGRRGGGGLAGGARDGNPAAAGAHSIEAPLRMAQPLAVELLSLRLGQVVQHFPVVGAPIWVAGAGAGAPLRGAEHSLLP